MDHKPHFNGPAYVPDLDHARLTGQIKRIFTFMANGSWRTLSEIATATDSPEASVSAQLRNMRKERFGGHTIIKRRRGEVKRGLFEYKLEPTYTQQKLL